MLTITADRPAAVADLGFIPSLGLRADIARFREMRSAWDRMAAAALDFDTSRYEQAKARFNIAKEG
jgi:hypothetical protein